MGGHHSARAKTVEWYTPPAVFDALGLRFDLDPCAPFGGVPWVPAARWFCAADDGLHLPWKGRVWLNPPYGAVTELWMRRLAAHGNGIALVFARTETRWWHETVGSADAVCFIRGRLTFVRSDGVATRAEGNGNAGAPSALIAFGDECASAVAAAELGMTFAVRSRELLGQASLWES